MLPNPQIPLTLLDLRAKVERMDPITEDIVEVYDDVPCTQGMETGYMLPSQAAVSVGLGRSIIIFRFQFNGATLALKPDDILTLTNPAAGTTDVYRIVAPPNNAESKNHHWEVWVEEAEEAGA